MRVRATMLVVSAAAIAAPVACRQLVGISDSPQTDLAPTTAACGLSWPTNDCASCVQASCCAASTACANDVACKGHFQCFNACKVDDWTCRARCTFDQSIVGAAEFPKLAACAASNCPSECGLVCGSQGALLAAEPEAGTTCERCLESNGSYCKSARDCDMSATCVGWEQCFGGCTTPDCRNQCVTQFGLDGGIAGTASPFDTIPTELSSSINGLGNGPCAVPCGGGSNWSCLDRTWPNSTLEGTTLETQVLDITRQTSVAGVSVSVCRFSDPTCDAPLNPLPTQSDANGFVKATVPPAMNFVATLGPDTFVKFSSPAIFPELQFLGYPVSEPVAPIASPYVLVTATSNPPAGWDTSLGLINAVVFDCAGKAAPGVTIATDVTDAGAIPYCFESTSGAITTGVSVTTANGAGYGCGFINMPPGMVTLTATPVGLGRPSSRLQVLAQPGTITSVFLYPTLTL
jgi:hypothetical protein